MTLASHAVVGAVIAKTVPGFHPIIQFGFAFFSHFLIDAIPHGHYSLRINEVKFKNPKDRDLPLKKEYFVDFAKIGLDFLIGMAIVILFLDGSNPASYLTLVIGAIGGVLPDALQFVYWKICRTPLEISLRGLQYFHLKIMHTKILLDKNQPLTFLVEASTILIFILLSRI